VRFSRRSTFSSCCSPAESILSQPGSLRESKDALLCRLLNTEPGRLSARLLNLARKALPIFLRYRCGRGVGIREQTWSRTTSEISESCTAPLLRNAIPQENWFSCTKYKRGLTNGRSGQAARLRRKRLRRIALIRSYLLDRVHPRKRRDRLRSRLDRSRSSRAKTFRPSPVFRAQTNIRNSCASAKTPPADC